MRIGPGVRVHFMGAGGIGVSALAELALARGAVVSGCDREENDRTVRLRARGAAIEIGHSPRHAEDADVLVYTSATPPDHPERVAAGAKAVRRGVALARGMDGFRTAGVAGTHGKTTTTALLAQLCLPCDPTVFVGGVVPALDGNFRMGAAALPEGADGAATGDRRGLFIAELDESDGSFLEPVLDVAVVANVESEHLAHYGSDEKMRAAFADFVRRVRPDGTVVLCADDPGARALRPFAREYAAAPHTPPVPAPARRVIRYGFADDADWRIVDLRAAAGRQSFRLAVDGGAPSEPFDLPLPGRHNAQNAVAALAAAWALAGRTPERSRALFPALAGAERRMQRVGDIAATPPDGGAPLSIPVLNDYAHHPTEVRAALAAARELAGTPLLVLFQPHLFTRTRDYAKEFGDALAAAEAVGLLDIYPAREAPLPGVTSALLADAVRDAGGWADGPFALREFLRDGSPEAVRAALSEHAAAAFAASPRAKAAGTRGFAAVLLMGAGDIGKVADAVAAARR